MTATHFNFKKLSFAIIACCFQLATVFAQSPQYENKIVETIDVIINTPVSSGADSESIKTRMKTKLGDHFTQNEFDNDLKTLAQDFDRVIPEVVLVEDKIHITMKVWLKPAIRTITWRGNQKVDTFTLQKELEIPLCSVFDRQAFNKAFHKLKAYYIKEGYFEAQLTYQVSLDPLTNEVDLEIIVDEGRSGKIKSIILCGFTRDEMDDILDLMVTKKYNFFTSWITKEGTFNEEAIQQDQFVITNYLQNRGYADAKVVIDITEAEECNRILVHITATKGAPYSFGRLSFSGNCIFEDEDIRRQFTICEGGVYSPEAIRATVDKITSFYGRKGYIDAEVNYEPRLADGCVYNVDFTISEGEPYRVGLIKVFGNCATQSGVILHETLLVPGEVFNTDKLKATEMRLQNVGFFKTVNVYAVRSDEECILGDNYRDVHIEVEETSTGHFGAFFGFSTVESIFGGFNITERSFNSAGLPYVWSDGLGVLRGGGEYAHFTATIGNKSTSYVFSWTKPYYMDTPWSVGFDIERTTTQYIAKDYDIKALGFTLNAMRQINPFLRFGWHYRIRNSFVDVHGRVSRAERKAADLSGLISATGISLLYDSTDHPLRPTRGFKSRLDIEFAGLGGDHSFLAFAYLNTYFYSVSKDGVLKFRGDFKSITPTIWTSTNEIPMDERLFLGGDETVRGYRAYKLGPRFSNGDPKGGLSLQFLSVEYIHRFFSRLDGFLFIDSGHLSFSPWSLGRMSTAVGFGARIQILDSTPPLTVGMGFPLNPRSRGEVKKFFLTVGGNF